MFKWISNDSPEKCHDLYILNMCTNRVMAGQVLDNYWTLAWAHLAQL